MARLAILLAVLFASVPAWGLTQPNGTTIPQRTDLQTLFTGRGETINAVTDAADMPTTFVPGCTLTFTVISRGGAAFQNAFGWYNVTGSPPADTDLHVLLPCTARPGDSATLDTRTDPAYRGGAIGFFLRTPEDAMCGCCAGGDCCASIAHTGHTYYTERMYNPDNIGAGSYIHLLIYDSSVTPRAFYFAWEDLFGGGDNEFTDFVAEVTNISCAGGGASCNTGHPGICSAGTQQCHAGMLTCVQDVQPRASMCNGLDNNCDGMIDTGPCPTGTVCDRGTCVPMCVEGGCFTGQVCTAQGTCVEAACATVMCPSGQRCVGGACVSACDGVTCPAGQACRAGRCVDPCSGVMCDSDQVCVAGICEARCPCRRCAASETCQMDGTCLATACVGVTCAPGTVCSGGACVDACMGAHCPTGETCSMGNCVAATADGGTGDAAASDAAREGGTRDGAAMGDARGDSGRFGSTHSGCGCRAAGGDGGAKRAFGIVCLLGIVAWVRRRRGGASAT
jgi:hypothetical protein